MRHILRFATLTLPLMLSLAGPSACGPAGEGSPRSSIEEGSAALVIDRAQEGVGIQGELKTATGSLRFETAWPEGAKDASDVVTTFKRPDGQAIRPDHIDDADRSLLDMMTRTIRIRRASSISFVERELSLLGEDAQALSESPLSTLEAVTSKSCSPDGGAHSASVKLDITWLGGHRYAMRGYWVRYVVNSGWAEGASNDEHLWWFNGREEQSWDSPDHAAVGDWTYRTRAIKFRGGGITFWPHFDRPAAGDPSCKIQIDF